MFRDLCLALVVSQAAFDLPPIFGDLGDLIVLGLFIGDMFFNFVLMYPDPATGELVMNPGSIAVRENLSHLLAQK